MPEQQQGSRISEVRQFFTDSLGAECIAELHRERRWLDLLALLAMPALFGLLVYGLTVLPFGPWWLLCMALQGTLLVTFGLVNHDLLMHRSVLKGRWKYVAGLCLLMPIYRSPTHFQYGHGAHHAHLGGAGDSEQFKVDIDTPWRRVLYATIVGALAPTSLYLRRERAVQPVPTNMRAVWPTLRREARLRRVFTLSWLVLAWFWPHPVIYGYVLPLCIVAPFVSSVRTVIEHSDFDPANPFQLSCYYRTNFLTRCLFFWDSGDCHFAHHVYPRIPFYHIPRAVRLMHPGFMQHHVVEHRSLWPLVRAWFADGRPYLSAPAKRG